MILALVILNYIHYCLFDEFLPISESQKSKFIIILMALGYSSGQHEVGTVNLEDLLFQQFGLQNAHFTNVYNSKHSTIQLISGSVWPKKVQVAPSTLVGLWVPNCTPTGCRDHFNQFAWSFYKCFITFSLRVPLCPTAQPPAAEIIPTPHFFLPFHIWSHFHLLERVNNIVQEKISKSKWFSEGQISTF